MLNSLDLLVIVFMVMAAASLLALCLMFLVCTSSIKKVCFYIVAALGIYAGYIGIRIGSIYFPVQTAVGVITAVASLAAMVLAVVSKGNDKKFKIARMIAAGALLVGFANAFLF